MTPLDRCQKSLAKNGFDVHLARDPEDAKAIFFEKILPTISVKTASWGDSMTMHATGVWDALFELDEIAIIKTFEEGVERSVIMERRRQALLVDLFMTGANALTETGRIVNLDMIGNRTAPIAFGPHHVVLFIGRNKIVPDLEAAITRIKTIAAPLNAARHDLTTPCVKTGQCHDCYAPKRICNTWSIMDKSYLKHRIKVIVIDGDLGL